MFYPARPCRDVIGNAVLGYVKKYLHFHDTGYVLPPVSHGVAYLSSPVLGYTLAALRCIVKYFTT